MIGSRLLPGVLLAAGLLVGPAATAGQPAAPSAALVPEDDGFEIENAFGFGQGAGIAQKGEWEVGTTLSGRFGKRRGSYRALGTETEAEYGITDRIQAGFAAFTSSHRIRGVPGLDNRSAFGFDGFAVGGKAVILERDVDGPIGFSVATELEWHRYDETEGARGRTFGNETAAILEASLVPNLLYVAANAGFEIERGRARGEKAETESSLFTSAALAWRFQPRMTLGAEARLEHAFEGVLGRHEGSALFLGPTFYAKVSNKVTISAAFGTQVWGSGPGRLNLDAFERHRAMVRVGVEF
ncbi:hypothetical protein [Prosthecomicrobium sp. N25]|uniref:hypothetical protein n=1 Tax=Prosthecomicrobium sp. N25 TaxID=3129254 RepID=UPI0030776B22